MAASEQPNHSVLEYHTARTVRISTASSNGLLGAMMLPWFEDVGPLCSVRGTLVGSLKVEAILLQLVLGETQDLVAAVPVDRPILGSSVLKWDAAEAD